MIDVKDIVRVSSALCADVLQGAQRLIAPDKTSPASLTADETEAIVMAALATAALLEGAAIMSLPADKAANVRAFTERLAHDIQTARNASATLLVADGIAAQPKEGEDA